MLPLKDWLMHLARRDEPETALPRPRPRWLAWRLAGWVVVGAMTATLIGSSWFVYDHVYRTLEDATTIIILSSAEDMEAINFAALAEAEQLVERKTALTAIPKNLRDPFVFGRTASSSAPTAPKK